MQVGLRSVWLSVEAAKMCVRSGCVSEAIFETLPTEAHWLMRGLKQGETWRIFLIVNGQDVSYRSNRSDRLI